MKKRFFYLLFFCYSSLLIGQKNNIKEILIKQLKAGNDQTYDCYKDYGEKDLDALVFIEDTILRNNGYKTLSLNNFNDKIKNIFGRIIDNNSQTKYLKVDQYFKCNKKLEFHPLSEYAQYLYIDKEHKFITIFYALPQILDYTKVYPEVLEYEKEKIIIKEYIEGTGWEKAEATQWKDHYDYLLRERRFHQQLLISRNKYLFNDDESQFDWLITNEGEFMERLVTDFGYTEDKKLLNWVMEKNYERPWEIVENSIFVKNCNGNLEIREGILNYIWENTNNEERKYAMQLLYLSDRDDWKDFSDSEYTKILAYMANTFDPLTEKYEQVGLQSSAKWSILGGLHFSLPEKEWNKLIKEFKKNNYYNLPHLQEAIKIAETY
ncbi:hypothetical protein [uncultured Apibacter sp.]|uniref:hypothetical protein n=1 Tax=uncultured Apibacter sp. TaxID=1778616 RepID=UPI0025F474EE|nr:hypothetical protein [uncultured Apibacter sp.]